MCLFRRNLFCGNRFTQAHSCAYSVPVGTPLNVNSLQMETSRFDDELNELAARDRYVLSSMQSGMTVRELYPDLPEEEVVRQWWGEYAPLDLAAMLVMQIGDSERVIAIPYAGQSPSSSMLVLKLSVDVTFG